MSDNKKDMVTALRMLSVDMIQNANSGHPGLPLGAAPMAYELWKNHMNFNPKNPKWFNRDRFVMSAGHGSALLYSLLHVFGYDLEIEDLKNFRKAGSRTPGHPEFGHTPGVDATTGPLGQGIAMAVGMAMAEAHLGARYNKEGFPLVDHYTFSLCGDGCLMEGISYEAASLAGHLNLGKLILLYDSNDISLDGELHHSFSEDVKMRFEAMNWQFLHVADGNNLDDISAAIKEAKAEDSRPTIIEVKTVIGYGSPNKAGKSAAHGAPLGKDEINLVRKGFEWDYPAFKLPESVMGERGVSAFEGKTKEQIWNRLFDDYESKFRDEAKELKRMIAGNLPDNSFEDLYKIEDKPSATRESSGLILNKLAQKLPELFGGSADLASSNKTYLNDLGDFTPLNLAGRNIWYGVREFAMGAIVNGMAMHGGIRPYGSTFFVFSDYLRSAIRTAALSKIPSLFVFTHDSIAVGEDGPTHEPIEHLASYRAMPGIDLFRPADAFETAAAYECAMKAVDRPSMLALSRQSLPILPGSRESAATGVAKGAYTVREAKGELKILLLATGSEVSLMVEVAKMLEEKGIGARVVSMPCLSLFDRQTAEYKEQILPSGISARLAAEMGSSFGWCKYIGLKGAIKSIDSFGLSGDGGELAEHFGFTPQNLCKMAIDLI